MKIYQCSICGNIAVMIEDKNVVPNCCGKAMTLLEARTEDEGREKHVPVVTQEAGRANIVIGSTMHPMTAEHRIAWVLLETDSGFRVVYLKGQDMPSVSICLGEQEKILAVYAYCNIHGLWVKHIA